MSIVIQHSTSGKDTTYQQNRKWQLSAAGKILVNQSKRGYFTWTTGVTAWHLKAGSGPNFDCEAIVALLFIVFGVNLIGLRTAKTVYRRA